MIPKVTIEIPNNKKLREFGITTGIIVAILFGVLLPWIFGHQLPLWPWVVSGLLLLWALLLPASLKTLYIFWMKFGHVLGFINTRIILGIMYYLIFVPIGMMMKLMGKDPMARKFDEHIDSYRVVRSHDRDSKHMERPY